MYLAFTMTELVPSRTNSLMHLIRDGLVQTFSLLMLRFCDYSQGLIVFEFLHICTIIGFKIHFYLRLIGHFQIFFQRRMIDNNVKINQ
jgi:hypothetical protein